MSDRHTIRRNCRQERLNSPHKYFAGGVAKPLANHWLFLQSNKGVALHYLQQPWSLRPSGAQGRSKESHPAPHRRPLVSWAVRQAIVRVIQGSNASIGVDTGPMVRSFDLRWQSQSPLPQFRCYCRRRRHRHLRCHLPRCVLLLSSRLYTLRQVVCGARRERSPPARHVRDTCGTNARKMLPKRGLHDFASSMFQLMRKHRS